MNRIVEKIGENGKISYEIMVDDNLIIGGLWTEKKGEKENIHIRWKEDGKYRYMMKSKFDEKKVDGMVELPEKIEKSLGEGWKSKATEEELSEISRREEKIKKMIEEIKSRPDVELSPEEKLEREIQKKIKELEKLRSKKV